MTKFDVVSVYWNLAVHPGYRPLLGMMWCDIFCGYGSPFWSAVSTLHLQCCRRHCPVDGSSQPWSWYSAALLGDFLTFGPPTFPSLLQQSAGLHSAVLQVRSTPSSRQARESSTCLSILGIERDSSTLPHKREKIIALVGTWVGKRFCRWRELESLIGHLHHACKVAPRVGPSYVAWSTCSTPYGVMITPLGWSRSSCGI